MKITLNRACSLLIPLTFIISQAAFSADASSLQFQNATGAPISIKLVGESAQTILPGEKKAQIIPVAPANALIPIQACTIPTTGKAACINIKCPALANVIQVKEICTPGTGCVALAPTGCIAN